MTISFVRKDSSGNTVANDANGSLYSSFMNFYNTDAEFKSEIDFLNASNLTAAGVTHPGYLFYVTDENIPSQFLSPQYNGSSEWAAFLAAHPDVAAGNYQGVMIISSTEFSGDTYHISGSGFPPLYTFEQDVAHETAHAIQDSILGGPMNVSDQDVLEQGAVNEENNAITESPYNGVPRLGHDALVPGTPTGPQTFNNATNTSPLPETAPDLDMTQIATMAQHVGADKAFDAKIHSNNPTVPHAQPTSSWPTHVEDLPDWIISHLKALWQTALTTSSPLVLDLSGDASGISLAAETSTDAVYWGNTSDGFGHASGWTSGSTGLLAVDANHNGYIDDNSELFGDQPASGVANGFEALSAFDTDGDGAITSNDQAFDQLLVWVDSNQDGVSQASELHSLSDLGISSINLAYNDVDYEVGGNEIKQQSTFTMNGDTRTIADAWFSYDAVNTIYNDAYTPNVTAFFLPDQRGYGLLPDLFVSMSIDDNTSDPASLLSLVQAFSQKTFADMFTGDGSAIDAVKDIMFRWAGVDGVDPTSRGPMVDGQELGFLEKLMGQDYVSRWWTTDPIGNQAADSLDKAFDTAINHVYAMLVAQTTAGREIFTGDYVYDVATDALQGITGLNLSTLTTLESEAASLSTTTEKDLFWRDVVRLVEYAEGTANLSGSDYTALDSAIHTTDSSLSLSGELSELLPGLYDGATVIGTSASETLTGGNQSDFLIGNGGDDTFFGNDGHDNIQGGSGNDTFTGGLGNDFEQGAAGNDVYVYNVGDGSDTVFDTAGIDKIVLGVGIDHTNLTFSRASNNDLRISIDVGSVHGEIIVSGQFDTANGATTQIETIEFTDGSSIDLTTLNNLELDGTSLGETLNGLQAVGGLDDIMNGNSGDDVVNGFDGNDTLHGNDGNDVVNGGNGTDTLYGDAGNDTLDGGAGDDTMAGGTGNDTYVVDSTNDVVIENSGEGTDTVVTSLNNYTLPSNVEGLTLTGSALIGNGNSLDNILVGNNSNNTLIGGDGNDTLNGAFGADTMNGGLGNDTFFVDNTSDVVIEASGQGTDIVNSAVTYTLSSSQEIEKLTLIGNGNINGTGNTLDNVIVGNIGNNTLSGGTGADTLIGGGGSDTFIVDNAGDLITGGTGIDTVSSSVSFILSSELENLTLTGSSVLTGTGNELGNTITGNTAADTLIGGLGDDTYVITNASTVITENAGEGNDTELASGTSGTSFGLADYIENLTLTGSTVIKGVGNDLDNIMNGNSASNTLNGGIGNDTLWGGTGGTDSLIGGTGDDTFTVDRTSGIVIVENAGEGTDTVQASVTYTLGANVENLVLTGASAINGTGNTLSNVITGNSANNLLSDGGAGGNDTLIGGGGNDTFTVNNSGDVILENAGEGIDLVNAAASYTLDFAQEIENLTLTGSTALTATGNALNNIITSNAGIDTLVGGAGDDTYIFNNTADTITENAGEGNDSEIASGVAGERFYIRPNVENLTLTGSTAMNANGNELDNVMNGNAGSNTLLGNDGNDTLWGGTAGTDSLIGGTGDDIYIVDRSTSYIKLFENSGEGTDTVQASITYTIGATSNIENLTLTGTAAINGTGDTLANVIIGNSGNNILSDGGAGDNDTLMGGDGNDTFTVNNTGDVIFENTGEGTDLVNAAVSYTLGAGQEIESLTLTGSSVLTGGGNEFDNTIKANTAADTLIGGDGNDTYVITNYSTVIIENPGEGIDTVSASGTTGTMFTLADNVENLTLTGSTAISGTGNSGDNVLTGNAYANALFGEDGNDVLNGGSGADHMYGVAGDDTYYVNVSTDVIVEGVDLGTDTVHSTITYTLGANLENLILDGASALSGTGNTLVNVITGNSAANALNGDAGADTLIGGAGNDTYTIDDVGDVVVENVNEGTDLVNASVSYTLSDNIEKLTLTGSADINGTGNDLVNIITGNAGNNILDGGAGADSMIGSTGNDTYYVDNAGDVITEGSTGGTDTEIASVSDTLVLYVEDLILDSDAGDIDGTGNTLVNIITGNSGDNTLSGGTGADTLIGGGGNDTFIVDNIGDLITADSGNDTIQSSISWDMSAAGHNNLDIENLTLTGSSVLVGSGNDLDNIITGNTAADTLIGGLGDDTYVITNASTVIIENADEGTDTVHFGSTTAGATYTLVSNIENLVLDGVAAINGAGNAFDNIISGNSGNNTLDGGAGADTIIGGTGNDVYVVDDAGDVIIENSGEGTDLVQSSITWTLGANFENLTLAGTSDIDGTGNSLNNLITGNSGVNTLTGGAGNDTLDGGVGIDTLVGGTGDDSFIVDNVGDVIVENANEGLDSVQSSVTYTLADNIEYLTLTGTASIDGTGNALNNHLAGNSGVNTLNAGDGNDSLDGGAGADTMIGGTGNDTYYADNTGDIVVENANEGTELVFSTVSYTLSANVEDLEMMGTATINGTGNELNNFIFGDQASAAHTLSGLGGDDILEDGGAHYTHMIGGTGDDTYYVYQYGSTDVLVENADEGTDLVSSEVTWTLGTNFENLTLTGVSAINGTGNSADNYIIGNNAVNTLNGGTGGNDTLFGMGGDDSLVTSAGNDTLDGGTGADTMNGGDGDNIYTVDNTGDVVIGGSGIDAVQSSVTWTLGTNTENLNLTGSANINGTGNTLDNVITGNSGFNTLSGGSGNDTLTSGSGGSYLDGGDGNDTLYGGAGLDTLHGGNGADTFLFQNATAFSAHDVIHDFSTSDGDKIDLRDVLTVYDPATMNIADFVKIDNALNGTDSVISVDQDGTGSGHTWTQLALIHGVQNLDVNTLITNGNLVVH